MTTPAAADFPDLPSVRAAYHSLCRIADAHFGGSLAGRFLLVQSLGENIGGAGETCVLAASIAGAASLSLGAPAIARQALRAGTVDFSVTTLDEALRILKNEIRKRQPVAVCVEAEASAVLAEMAERGAQPDLIAATEASPPTENPLLQPFVERGAVLLPVPASIEPAAETADLRSRQEVCWRSDSASAALLREVDALAASVLPPNDAERRNWLARAPRYLPRALRHARAIPMTPAEVGQFQERLQTKIASGELQPGITLQAGSGEAIRL